MNINRLLAITRKDFKEIKRNKMILYSMIVMPIIFAVIVPMSSVMGLAEAAGEDYEMLLIMITSGFIPLFILLPAAIPSVIASYSFVGEKTEKTLEPLLATPITDKELLLGKILASFIPGVLLTIVAFVILTVITDIITYPHLGYLLLPNITWLLAILVLAPLVALASITITIILSSRMSDPRAVQQLSVIIILPFMAIFFGVIAQLIVLDVSLLTLIIVIVAIADRVLFSMASKLFKREAILTSWK
jgi:ABC-2 type transport system permease protein